MFSPIGVVLLVSEELVESEEGLVSLVVPASILVKLAAVVESEEGLVSLVVPASVLVELEAAIDSVLV